MPVYANMVDQLLDAIVDSQEKLDVLVYLHSAGGGHSTAAVATAVNQPCVVVLEALSALMTAGVVTVSEDGLARWQLDPFSGWSVVIGVVAELHASNRLGLLRRITTLALDRLRAESGGDLRNVIVLRPAEH